MINRIKEWDIKNLKINDRQVISLALILSIMALVMAIPSSSNCASANTCTVASTGTFTGNLGIKSNTAYQLTQQHSLAVDQIANWESVGGNHTGSVIMKDNSGDFNLNGGLVLGTSATSTNGTIRWNGSEVQVYNSGWSGVGGTPTNDIGQVTADSGSFTAATQQDNINIIGGTNITTSITSDTLTINASIPAASTEYANFHLSSDQTLTYAGFGSTSNIDFDTERFDTENCFSADSSGTITYDSGCNSAYYNVQLTNIINFSGLTNNGAMIQGAMNAGTGGYNYRTWVTLFSIPNYTLNFNRIVCLDPNDTVTVNFFHGSGYSTGSAKWLSGYDDSSLSLIKLNEKGSSC